MNHAEGFKVFWLLSWRVMIPMLLLLQRRSSSATRDFWRRRWPLLRIFKRTKETEEIDASVLVGEKVLIDTRLEEIHLGPKFSGLHIGTYAEAVVEVPLKGDAALTDVDTPESLSAVKAEIERA
jgi:hypothetical protein